MKHLISTSILLLVLSTCFAQQRRNVALYLQGQYTHTVSDATRPNNPWGMGLGLQAFFNNRSSWKPVVEVTADAYLEDDKVYRLNDDGTPMNVVDGMVNLFAGGSYHASNKFYISFAAGPSFIGGSTKFGMKPSFGFYFSSSQKWTGRVSYLNIVNRDEKTKQDFSAVSLAVGVRLF